MLRMKPIAERLSTKQRNLLLWKHLHKQITTSLLTRQPVRVMSAKNDNEFHTLSDQDASTISSVSEIEQVQKNEEITRESYSHLDSTNESQVSNELQSEIEVSNEMQGDSNSQQSEVLDEDEEDKEMSWIDMSFSQPLVPQLSEVVRVGVIARVPEDYTPVNDHVSHCRR